MARAKDLSIFVPYTTIVVPNTTIPATSSGSGIVVTNFKVLTGIFFITAKPAGEAMSDKSKTSESRRFTLVPASDRERLS